jgi:hypothetical protein
VGALEEAPVAVGDAADDDEVGAFTTTVTRGRGWPWAAAIEPQQRVDTIAIAKALPHMSSIKPCAGSRLS